MATSLDLLGSYSSENEEEKSQNSSPELKNGNSRKRSLDNEDDCPGKKKALNGEQKNRLPPPNIQLKEVAPSIDQHVEADSSLHNGRVRSFAHERGNWATFVYIQYEDDGLVEMMCSDLKKIFPKLMNVDDYHISVTKTFVLRHHLIEPFVKTVKDNIKSIEKFDITFGDLQIYTNEDKTRTFVGLKVSSGVKDLLRVVEEMDKSLEDYKLPVYYEDPSFHMSILWCTGDHKEELLELLEKLNETFYKIIESSADNFNALELSVDRLICKTGNQLYHLPF
ncbi:U6 snRNA phosphodiesterase [Ctenocephalides felis]|uniref:U6 snRNA phosphodiesterase n=1 Tax=Ctenocephalides felis TaxID=7515 RepID=UPI000E6E121B|nr:U6 snRNA phosphodiesterase [Ctenocephalides felis]